MERNYCMRCNAELPTEYEKQYCPECEEKLLYEDIKPSPRKTEPDPEIHIDCSWFVFFAVLALLFVWAISMRLQMNGIKSDMDKLSTKVDAMIAEDATITPAPTKAEYSLTPAERETIERVVMAEARGESCKGQIAVAQVILDRAQSWGMSISDVLTADNQFCKPYKGKISESVKDAVTAVFDRGERAFKERTTYFYAYRLCSPDWAEDYEVRGTLGGHRFLG